MSHKLQWILIIVLVISLGTVGVVGAQDDDGRDRQFGNNLGIVVDTVSTALGLTPEEVLQMVRDGMTLAEIIEANGGDVAAIEAAIVADLTDEINENAEALIGNLDERVSGWLEGDFPAADAERPFRDRDNRRFGNPEFPQPLRDFAGEIIAQTDLEVSDLVEQLQAGETIADIASANDLDINELTATVEANFATRLNEAVENERLTQEEADERLAEFSASLNDAINTPLPELLLEQRQDAFANRAILQAMTDALDGEPRELLRNISADQTVADFITENGGDVEAISAAALEIMTTTVNDSVENGRLSEENGAAILADADTAISERLNETFRVPRENRRGRRN